MLPSRACVVLVVLSLAACVSAEVNATASSTKPPTVEHTKPPTAKPTEPPTKKATEPPTAKPTEPPTKKAETTAPPTKAPATKPTELPTKTEVKTPVTKPDAEVHPRIENSTTHLLVSDNNVTTCTCAGVSDALGKGGASCKSIDPLTQKAYCFVKQGECNDQSEFLKKVLAFKPGYDLSFDACACANGGTFSVGKKQAANRLPSLIQKTNGGCVCANKLDSRGLGSCNASFAKRERPWCYVKEGSCCDGKPSEVEMKGFDFSNDACSCVNNPLLCRCDPMAVEEQVLRGGGNHGQCNSFLSSDPLKRPYCYVRPGSCCDGNPTTLIGKKLWHVSHAACTDPRNGRLAFRSRRSISRFGVTKQNIMRRRNRNAQRGKLPKSSSKGHYWIIALVIVLIGAGGMCWVVVAKKRGTFNPNTSTPSAGGAGRESRAARDARHAPPAATYGPLSSSRARIDWPDNTALHGKVMWASTYNEASDTYICKTHEPGPNGVKPYSLKSDKLVAEVE